ncbi:hypothetical protein BT69DRAFT_200162 [Atractiella rhizophila]|nr:hypothetical protein BT69DRAFT_200162 [Atractiella rhizophila]
MPPSRHPMMYANASSSPSSLQVPSPTASPASLNSSSSSFVSSSSGSSSSSDDLRSHSSFNNSQRVSFSSHSSGSSLSISQGSGKDRVMKGLGIGQVSSSKAEVVQPTNIKVSKPMSTVVLSSATTFAPVPAIYPLSEPSMIRSPTAPTASEATSSDSFTHSSNGNCSVFAGSSTPTLRSLGTVSSSEPARASTSTGAMRPPNISTDVPSNDTFPSAETTGIVAHPPLSPTFLSSRPPFQHPNKRFHYSSRDSRDSSFSNATSNRSSGTSSIEGRWSSSGSSFQSETSRVTSWATQSSLSHRSSSSAKQDEYEESVAGSVTSGTSSMALSDEARWTVVDENDEEDWKVLKKEDSYAGGRGGEG